MVPCPQYFAGQTREDKGEKLYVTWKGNLFCSIILPLETTEMHKIEACSLFKLR